MPNISDENDDSEDIMPVRLESKGSADNRGLFGSEEVVTDGAPRVVVENLNATFVGGEPANQTNRRHRD